MKNLKTLLTTKQNNLGWFFQLTVFALFGIMTLMGANAPQTFAQTDTLNPAGFQVRSPAPVGSQKNIWPHLLAVSALGR
jgi:hypothetical protein